MAKATITFDTDLTLDALITKLNADQVLGILASSLGAYPVVAIEHDETGEP